jgi:hypothetical protein
MQGAGPALGTLLALARGSDPAFLSPHILGLGGSSQQLREPALGSAPWRASALDQFVWPGMARDVAAFNLPARMGQLFGSVV